MKWSLYWDIKVSRNVWKLLNRRNRLAKGFEKGACGLPNTVSTWIRNMQDTTKSATGNSASELSKLLKSQKTMQKRNLHPWWTKFCFPIDFWAKASFLIKFYSQDKCSNCYNTGFVCSTVTLVFSNVYFMGSNHRYTPRAIHIHTSRHQKLDGQKLSVSRGKRLLS